MPKLEEQEIVLGTPKLHQIDPPPTNPDEDKECQQEEQQNQE